MSVYMYIDKVEKVPMRCYGEKPRSFYALNPSGGIPVAIIRGKVIAESKYEVCI